MHEAGSLGLTVFHATLPSDDFVANCSLTFDELLKKEEMHENDIWINLEPGGKIHVVISLEACKLSVNLHLGISLPP